MDKICRHCKIREGTMVDCRSVLKSGKIKKRMSCNECNTSKLRKYRKTLSGKLATYRSSRKYMLKHKKSVSAWMKVNYKLNKGTIKKPKVCSICKKKKKLDAHHEDYVKPYEITWVCRLCHKKIH